MASKESEVTKEEPKVEDLTVDESQQKQVKGGVSTNHKFTLTDHFDAAGL